jgi:Major Facilitator Superfamily
MAPMSSDRIRPDAVRPPSGPHPSPAVVPVSDFTKLARTHALMVLGDVAMFAALSGSVLFSLSPDAQRSKVLLYLLVSVAPFAVVAPLIGPTLDRMKGGRRVVMQITALARAAIYAVMAFHVDDLFLYPLVFGAMILSKTYAVSKSALVPTVVRTEEELVEANSKLSLIASVVGLVLFAPLAGLGKLSPGIALFVGAGVFVAAASSARQLPNKPVALRPAEAAEREELRSAGIVLASGAMALIRAAVGFLFFHLFFWMRADYGLAQFGLAALGCTLGIAAGNVLAQHIRRRMREELMIVGALGIIAVGGTLAAVFGGVGAAVLAGGLINLASALGRLAFDSIVQRDAPDANQGRAFAKFEARFQLSWVLAGVVPVLFTMPGRVGFLVVAAIGASGAASYVVGIRAVRSGRPVPQSLTARARRQIAARARRRH